jgi:mannose-6-phosphate isomerase-like protein (cupin superfamily)
VDFGDIRSRVATNRGWKITHFKGDAFEVIYELIAAGNATGKVKHETADRSFRVLEGGLYVLLDGQSPIEVRRNQAFSLPKGTEYELSSNTRADVEVLFCQGSDYEEGLEIIEEPHAVRSDPMTVIPEAADRAPRVDGAKAQAAAAGIRRERMARQKARTPVPKKNPDGTPAGHGRAPLAGQAVTGTNPRPIGAGGYQE